MVNKSREFQFFRPNQGCYTFCSYMARRQPATKWVLKDTKRTLKDTKITLTDTKEHDFETKEHYFGISGHYYDIKDSILGTKRH